MKTSKKILKKLNNDIQPLKPDSEEYNMIMEYVRNTHAETHDQYNLLVEDIYKVERKHQHASGKNHGRKLQTTLL
jgi:hypothetical protein